MSGHLVGIFMCSLTDRIEWTIYLRKNSAAQNAHKQGFSGMGDWMNEMRCNFVGVCGQGVDGPGTLQNGKQTWVA